MTGPEQTVGIATKVVEVLRDLPLWLLTGLALSAGVLLWIPLFASFLPPAIRPFIVIGGVIFGILAMARGISILLERIPVWKEICNERRRFHLTAEPQQSFWSNARQSDDSIVTQVEARFVVKNRTNEPLALMHARLIKPRIHGEIVHEDVYVRAVDRNIYGDATDGYLIPSRKSLPASATIMIRGVPWRKLGKQIRIKIGISDDEGYEQLLAFNARVLAPAESKPTNEPSKPVEIVSSISDPVERKVVSVLQAEMGRYEKCGRNVGGLGSIHLAIDGREMTGVGTDSWQPNSPKNQSIFSDPDRCELRSDNLDALLAYYGELPDVEQKQFISALLTRIDGKIYLPVTYFIVCVLWKVGRLSDALKMGKVSLPQGEIKVFGLSNALMLLNGLLRYKHPDFTNDMLDQIEEFLVGLKEHPFQIPEKLAAIRTARLGEAEKR